MDAAAAAAAMGWDSIVQYSNCPFYCADRADHGELLHGTGEYFWKNDHFVALFFVAKP